MIYLVSKFIFSDLIVEWDHVDRENGAIYASSTKVDNLDRYNKNNLNRPTATWMSSGYDNEWLEFQFQQVVKINGIQTIVKDRDTAFKSFEIQYNDGANWTTIETGIRSPEELREINKFFSITRSNKFRLNLINSYGNNRFEIIELKLSFVKG